MCVNILFICFLDNTLFRYFKKSNLLKYAVLGIYLITFLLRYTTSIGVGIQESVFRYSIGNYIENISNKNESLMLEPAGWIPYPTNLKIIDEVGLISKDFYKYLLKKEKKESIVSYWRKEKPEYLIQRNHIFKRKDSLANEINDEDYLWFTKNYQLIKKFDYQELIKSEKSIFKKYIMKISASTNYYLFKIKEI